MPDGSEALLGVGVDMPCCEKDFSIFMSQREPGHTGASWRTSFFTQTPSPCRSKIDVQNQAEEYKGDKSKAEADRIQKIWIKVL